MSTESVDGILTLFCDDCGHARFDDQGWSKNARDLFDRARSDGWRSFKKGHGWKHGCPACVKDYSAGQNAGRLV